MNSELRKMINKTHSYNIILIFIILPHSYYAIKFNT